ncbi:MAG: SRPBCC family protein [Cyanobacteria bacterium J06643_5]
MKRIIFGSIVILPILGLLLFAGYSTTAKCNHPSLPSLKPQDARKFTVAPLRALIRIRLEAPTEEVFDYLSNSKALPKWMPGLKSLNYDHSNSINRGILSEGSKRKMMFGNQAEIEKIVQFDRPNLIAYQIVEGVPLRNHLAMMNVEESGTSGSYLTWYQYFDIKKSSLMGWFMPFMVRRFLNDASYNLIEEFGGTTIELNSCN